MATMRKLLALILCLFIVISSYPMVYAQEAPVSPTPVIEEATPTPAAQEPTQTPFIEEATPTPAALEPTQTPFIEDATPTPAALEPTQTPFLEEATPTPAALEPTQPPFLEDATPTPAAQEPTQTPFIEEATPTPTVTQTPVPEYTEQLFDTAQAALGCTVTRNVVAAVSGDMLEWTIEPTGGVAPYTVESYVSVTFANNSSRSHYTAEQTWTEGPYVQQCLAADAGVYKVHITVTDAEDTVYWVALYNQYPITVTQNPEVPAPELLSATVERTKTDATVGDTLTWTITPTGGTAPYRVSSSVKVYRADNSNSSVVPSHTMTEAPYIQQCTADEVGTYKCFLNIYDANDTTYSLMLFDLYPIAVHPEATDIQLTDTAIELKVGQEAYAGASVLPSDASQLLTYSSADPLIATVDSTGVIQAVSTGTAVITVETMDGTGLTADVTVTVVEEPAPNSMRAFVHGFEITSSMVDGSLKKGLVFTFGSQDGTAPYAYRITVLRDGLNVYDTTDTEGGQIFVYGTSSSLPTGHYQVFVSVTDGMNSHDTAYAAMQVTNSGNTLDLEKDVAPLVKATGVLLSATALTVLTGESQFLTETVEPNNVTNAAVTWESSDTSVVEVSPSGHFTALQNGIATITATTTDGTNKSATCQITVRDPAESISIIAPASDVRMGSTLSLSASVLPATAGQSVTWSSSDTDVATVSASGLVTPLTTGPVTITATTSDGTDVSATVDLTILPSLISSISLTCREMVDIGERWNISALVYPDSADSSSIVFSSSDPDVLFVGVEGSQVYMEGISVGQAVVTVSATDGSGITQTETVSVIGTSVNVLGFDYCPSQINVKQNIQIRMYIAPSDAYNKTIAYESSDPSVLKVDENGMLTGVAPGEAVITASTTDGSNMSVSTTVSVNVPVSSIKLTCPNTAMAGTEFNCTIEVLPLNAQNRSVTIAYSKSGIISINSGSQRGTAISVGQTTVTVTANDGSGVSFSKTITVTPRLVDTVVIDYCPSTLRLNQTVNLLASCRPNTAANKTLSYTSSKPSVVRVDSNGLLRGLALGQATITVKATDGSNASASRVVTVLPPYPDRISMNFSNLTLAQGQVSTLLKATPIPGNADATFTWSSSNKSVATVDQSGKITAVGLGTATIYAASANGVKAYCSVTVVRPGQAVTSISLSKTSASIDEGKGLQLKASVLPQQATDKSVRWSSSNPAVASVSGSGYVNGLTPGVAVITATAASGLKAQCTISVKSLAVTQVVMSKGYLELDEGKTATLKASVLPMNARFKAVTWSSSNTAIATVSPSGKIITYKPGTVKITATAHNGIKGTCTLVVRSLAVRSLSLNKSAVVLRPGRYITLKATIQPTNARFKTVIWSSSNPAVAVAAQSGKVTATGRGTAVITATAHNGVKVSCTVTVP